MESLFGVLAWVVLLGCLPCGFLAARRCTKNVAGRVLLTLVFGAIFLVIGLIAVVSGCSAMGGRMDFK
jgi:hypothetical protein